MAMAKSRTETLNALRQLRDAQQRVEAQIAAINRQLAQIEARKIPDSQPYVTLQWVTGIEDLAAPRKPLKEALKEDLAELKRQLRQLRSTAGDIRRRNPWVETLQAKRRALSTSMDIRRRLKDALQDQERTGNFDGEALAGLVDEAEKNLERFVIILERDPSKENARNTLKEMEVPLIFRSQCRTGACERAVAALESAGKRWVEEAKDRFVKDPTPENARKLLQDGASAALLGHDDTAGIGDAIDAGAEKMRQNAEQTFRRNPTVQNFKTLEQADRLCIQWGKAPLEPRGMRPVPPGTVHVVAPGETLSAISQRYFGSPGYWDVIYKKNADVIRDPSAIVAGTSLRIF